MMKPYRYRLTGSVGVKVFLSLNPHLLPPIHFFVFDSMHTVNNVVGYLGLEFLRESAEHPHFHS
ncbi:MAG TPA: hypothetical protein VHA33_07020 [Candidatus Angelobacter sp.]|nr:hypothetical protein [Candidatus Angelobacter sp.]